MPSHRLFGNRNKRPASKTLEGKEITMNLTLVIQALYLALCQLSYESALYDPDSSWRCYTQVDSSELCLRGRASESFGNVREDGYRNDISCIHSYDGQFFNVAYRYGSSLNFECRRIQKYSSDISTSKIFLFFLKYNIS